MPLTATRWIGDAEVTILTDGATVFGPDLFPGTDPTTIATLLLTQNRPAIETNFNAVLIRSGGRVVLCDAGPRDLFGPSCGNLPRSLPTPNWWSAAPNMPFGAIRGIRAACRSRLRAGRHWRGRCLPPMPTACG